MCMPSLTGSQSSSESAVKLTLCLCGSLGAQPLWRWIMLRSNSGFSLCTNSIVERLQYFQLFVCAHLSMLKRLCSSGALSRQSQEMLSIPVRDNEEGHL